MTKLEMLELFIKLAIKFGRYPSQDDMDDVGVTRAMVRTHYGTLNGLKNAAADTGMLTGAILDIETFPNDYIKTSVKKLSKYRRFVITSAVVNAPVNEKYFNSIKTYCKFENACLIVIPSLVKSGTSKYTLDPILRDEVVMFYDYNLNSNIKILGMASNAKTTDPITGLPRLGKRNGSLIVGSPKQNLKLVPTGISKLPHALMSTGAITKSSYTNATILKAKTDIMADNDHVIGALIVELDKNDMFHYRQTQADHRNGFTDLGSYYIKGRKYKFAPDALVGGDIHVTETCPISEAAMFDIIKRTGASTLVGHDVFTGRSVNHHESEKRLFLAKRADKNELSIDLELNELTNWLNKAASKVKQVVVVRSNHDEFLNGYLESGAYTEHPYNHRIALRLAEYVLDGLNPLEEACKRLGLSKRVLWLKRDQSFKLGGIELGAHGDKGANGARGSAKSMEEGYGACVYGHSHTSGIMRSAYCVGTNTITKPYYGSGPNSWLNTDCLVYPNGVRQLINKIEGSWTTREF